MKPTEILGRVLPRWRAKLPPQFSRAEVDGFVRRHQRVLEDLVVLAVAKRRAEAGHRPEAALEFAVVVAGSVVALRDHMGSLSIHPDRRGTLDHLYTDLSRAEETILRMRNEQPLEWNTKERLQRYALAIWSGARAAASPHNPPRTSP